MQCLQNCKHIERCASLSIVLLQIKVHFLFDIFSWLYTICVVGVVGEKDLH